MLFRSSYQQNINIGEQPNSNIKPNININNNNISINPSIYSNTKTNTYPNSNYIYQIPNINTNIVTSTNISTSNNNIKVHFNK